MISAHVSAVEHGASEGVEIAAHELDTAFIGDAAVLVGAIEIGAAVLGDFERRGFVFARDAENEIVEAVGPNFPGEVGERAFVGVEIGGTGSVFAGAGRNGGNDLAAVVASPDQIHSAPAHI